MKKIFLVILLFVVAIVFKAKDKFYINDISFPVPTEYVEKKKNKKIFKQNRKKWMENMVGFINMHVRFLTISSLNFL